jgi:hypothetical protein
MHEVKMQVHTNILNKALHLIISLRDSVNIPILRNICYIKFGSILKYDIIFWVEKVTGM